jgi:hypothetical protein
VAARFMLARAAPAGVPGETTSNEIGARPAADTLTVWAGRVVKPVDSHNMTLIFGETVRDIVSIAAIGGQPLHPHARLFLQPRDKASQFAACVPGVRHHTPSTAPCRARARSN